MNTIRPDIQLELAREIARKIEENERRNMERALAVKLCGKSTEPRDTTFDKSALIERREKFNAELNRQEALSCARGIGFSLAIVGIVSLLIWALR